MYWTGSACTNYKTYNSRKLLDNSIFDNFFNVFLKKLFKIRAISGIRRAVNIFFISLSLLIY